MERIAETKEGLRRAMRAVRRTAAAHRPDAAIEIARFGVERLGRAARSGACVAGYHPLSDELDPRPLMVALTAEGAGLALPVVMGPDRALIFRAWSPGDALESGVYGTRHPVASAPEIRPEILLVPLLAFDRQCNRLGYGAGYYDRTLAALRLAGDVTAYGVAYSAQALAELPFGDWDQPLDGILTERGFVDNPSRTR